MDVFFHVLKIRVAFGKRISCFAHNLQLVIGALFNRHIVHYSGFRSMCGILKAVKHSVQMNEEIRVHCKLRVKTFIPTRWGSIVSVLGRFLEMKDVLLTVSKSRKKPFPSPIEIIVNLFTSISYKHVLHF